MNSEILKELVQMFAIIAKQDKGVELRERVYVKAFLIHQLSNEKEIDECNSIFNNIIENLKDEYYIEAKPTSVIDSVRILGITKKIDTILDKNQKIIILVRLYELINANRKLSDQRIAIIRAIAEVFKISVTELQIIEDCIKNSIPGKIMDESEIFNTFNSLKTIN